MSGTSGDDGGSGGLLRLLAVGDFVGVAVEIFRGPRSGPVCAAETNSSRAGVLGDADTAVGAAIGLVQCQTFWVPRIGQLAHGRHAHVVSYKDRASGAEGSAEVCGLFKCGTDLIFECNEMTTVTHGAMGADLGSATA